ncbi:hypothetical protein [Agrococcus baldri]|uniref:Lipoprotein n=1 Tax=Agrococcus baldri TaxID=153730 RepID=A0AA87REB5_9MICO|nr:hypothetical protein [Agrococcus baldri]GEK81334.1 hypothetical protein ABA31_26850 [Agrococcus baldri]
MHASIRRTTTALAALAAATLLVACAQSAPQQTPAAPSAAATSASAPAPDAGPGTTPDATTDAVPTRVATVTGPDAEPASPASVAPRTEEDASPPPQASEAPAEEPGPVEQRPAPMPVHPGAFTTQYGSASFTMPAGWSGTDRSWSVPDPDTGSPTWINIVELDGPGVRLSYLDTPQFGGSWSFDPERWQGVDARPVGDDDLAQAFWTVEHDRYVPRVALTFLEAPNDWGFEEGAVRSPVWFGDSASNYRFEAAFDERPSFASEAEAVEFLQSPVAVAALEAIASIELTGIDGHTMP